MTTNLAQNLVRKLTTGRVEHAKSVSGTVQAAAATTANLLVQHLGREIDGITSGDYFKGAWSGLRYFKNAHKFEYVLNDQATNRTIDEATLPLLTSLLKAEGLEVLAVKVESKVWTESHSNDDQYGCGETWTTDHNELRASIIVRDPRVVGTNA